MAEKNENAPTTQRTKALWKIGTAVVSAALAVVVVVFTGGRGKGGGRT